MMVLVGDEYGKYVREKSMFIPKLVKGAVGEY